MFYPLGKISEKPFGGCGDPATANDPQIGPQMIPINNVEWQGYWKEWI